MKYIVDAKQMKEADRRTTAEMLIPEAVLMERAALAVRDVIGQEYQDARRILIVCGGGNNGADGLALARLLLERGSDVSVILCAEPTHQSESNHHQMESALRYGLKITNLFEDSEYGVITDLISGCDLIVDAMFGTGLSREITGRSAQLICCMNEAGVPILSVDMPSGIHTDTGQIMGTAVCAERTVTFSYAKIGLLLYPGAEYAGKVTCHAIGITDASFDGILPSWSYLEAEDLNRFLPKRNPAGNKGTFGKVTILASNQEISGAAVLSALACFRTGAGMVRVVTAAQQEAVLRKSCPEALITTLDAGADGLDAKSIERLKEAVLWADVLIIGPGIGTAQYGKALLTETLALAGGRILLCDADALNLIAAERNLLKKIEERLPDTTIFTPHMGELARLTGMPVTELKHCFLPTAEAYAIRHHLILCAKDARTYSCNSHGCGILNINGNSGMATAGSGDVLTGVIAALAAQGAKPFDAVTLGAWLHAAAGDVAAAKLGEASVMASDIVNAIPQVLCRASQKRYDKNGKLVAEDESNRA